MEIAKFSQSWEQNYFNLKALIIYWEKNITISTIKFILWTLIRVTSVNDQLDVQYFYFVYVFYSPVHVSSDVVFIISRSNCIKL